MALAVYGKHPAKGDFLDYGLPAALKTALEGWLDTVLAETKAALGTEWQRVWPAAPMLRFWVGEAIWGMSVTGVMATAHDRVGRRFPLVLLALQNQGNCHAPPVIDPDQTWYDAACAHLDVQLQRGDLPGPAALIEDAPHPTATDALAGPADFWAARLGANVGGLLADIASTDHRRANAGRSYWWVAGTTEGVQAEVDSEPVITGDPGLIPKHDAAQITPETPVDDFVVITNADETANTNAADIAHWDGANRPDTDASPFSSDRAGSSLFAEPEPYDGFQAPPETTPQISAPIAPREVWSQVWAGPGLPSGAVLAWFFRGHAGND